MTTEIRNKKTPSQTVAKSPNLGGPTIPILDSTEKEIYRAWADRYAILNGWSNE